MFRRKKPEDGSEGNDPTPIATPEVADQGLGVPPYRGQAQQPPRPAPAPTIKPTMPTQPGAQLRPATEGASRPPGSPGPTAPGSAGAGRRVESATAALADRRTLVVGRGIALSGTITDCERLVVEGTVEATVNQGSEILISTGGVFRGEIEIDQADIHGTFDGTLTARDALVVRSTGRVLGTVRCRRLTVEEGGEVSGKVDMLNVSSSSRPAERPMPATPVMAEG